MRQGLTRKDDHWPDRFYKEPLSEGPAAGAVLSRPAVDKLLDGCYEIKGWDKGSGLPTRKKLIELGLDDIASNLLYPD